MERETAHRYLSAHFRRSARCPILRNNGLGSVSMTRRRRSYPKQPIYSQSPRMFATPKASEHRRRDSPEQSRRPAGPKCVAASGRAAPSYRAWLWRRVLRTRPEFGLERPLLGNLRASTRCRLRQTSATRCGSSADIRTMADPKCQTCIILLRALATGGPPIGPDHLFATLL